MRVLTLDAALAACSAALVADGVTLAARRESAERGQAGTLPLLARAVLAEAGHAIDLIAVIVGPGSFTGLRAALALAHGVGSARGCAVVGVTIGEALAAQLPPTPDRALWVATGSKRAHVFLERAGAVVAVTEPELPAPAGKVIVAGDAAIAVAGRLAARGADVLLADARWPEPAGIAAAALARQRGTLPPRPAQPLYVDPPETRAPAIAPRPPPVPSVAG